MEQKYIKTDNTYCPYCKDKHPVDLYIREEGIHINGKPVKYIAFHYKCGGDEFTTELQARDNMDRANEAYKRRIHTGQNSLVVRIGN